MTTDEDDLQVALEALKNGVFTPWAEAKAELGLIEEALNEEGEIPLEDVKRHLEIK